MLLKVSFQCVFVWREMGEREECFGSKYSLCLCGEWQREREWTKEWFFREIETEPKETLRET